MVLEPFLLLLFPTIVSLFDFTKNRYFRIFVLQKKLLTTFILFSSRFQSISVWFILQNYTHDHLQI